MNEINKAAADKILEMIQQAAEGENELRDTAAKLCKDHTELVKGFNDFEDFSSRAFDLAEELTEGAACAAAIDALQTTLYEAIKVFYPRSSE